MFSSDPPQQGRARILVIDDEPDMRETLDVALSSEGYKVATAESGLAAIALAQRELFDLAIADLRMPGLSGVDTIARLRRLHPTMAVLVVSAYVSDESARRCREEGVFRILAKPVQFEDLMQAVDHALHSTGVFAATPGTES